MRIAPNLSTFPQSKGFIFEESCSQNVNELPFYMNSALPPFRPLALNAVVLSFVPHSYRRHFKRSLSCCMLFQTAWQGPEVLTCQAPYPHPLSSQVRLIACTRRDGSRTLWNHACVWSECQLNDHTTSLHGRDDFTAQLNHRYPDKDIHACARYMHAHHTHS